jgi:hypothetical protein
MTSLLLRLLGVLICVGVVAFTALMVHDFKTDYRRFAELTRRRDARKRG